MDDDQNEGGACKKEKREEGGVVSSPNAVIHPLAVMITGVHAVVAQFAVCLAWGPIS